MRWRVEIAAIGGLTGRRSAGAARRAPSFDLDAAGFAEFGNLYLERAW